MERKPILDRENPKRELNEIFESHLICLKDIIDYGTYTILRYSSLCERDDVLYIVIGVLFKQYLALLDSIEILFSNCAILASNTNVRSLWETSLYIEWILLDDQEKRSRQYYVWYLRKMRNMYNRSVPNSLEYKEVEKSINNSIPEMIKFEMLPYPDAAEKVKNIEAILSNEKSESIDREFSRLMKKYDNKYDVDWFVPNGPSSIGDMAQRLNKSIEYLIIYDKLSGNSHGTNMGEHIKFKKEKFSLEPIRSSYGVQFLLKIVFTKTINTYIKVISYFRPLEIENFKKKYDEEWKKIINSVENIKINYNIHAHSLDLS